MTTATFFRWRAERFAQLLDEANGGRRHHTRSRIDTEVGQLVTLSHRTAALRPSVDTEIDPDFKAGLRAMLLATAERDGIGVTAVAAEPEPATKAASVSALARFGPRAGQRTVEGGGLSVRGRRLRTRGAILAGVAVGAIAVSGISTASEDAQPGDALYGVKRSTERAQLALASSDVNRGQLHLDFARTRLTEASAANTAGATLPTLLADMDSDTRSGVKLLTTAAASRRDDGPLRSLDAFLTGQQAGVAKLVTRADGEDRQRAIESRTLLEDVRVRVDALRRTLACGASPDANTDSLGPLPRTCGVVASDRDSSPTNAPGRQGVQPPAEESRGGTQPERTSAPGTPTQGSASPTVGATATESPVEPSESPTGSSGGGLLDQVGRILGDLLGGG
ncbi:DUF5667 domain-containing protein [Rhizomonospora bruguierae]|uniref:DUF5667 domain-containing protein n=1 Tax=Rhizomonospora bruguierae TaxID=1581705 RepID=UPI0020BED121|nr:DUF5667 domain-containing protein [Micromonospora sp. NBRC 107566]